MYGSYPNAAKGMKWVFIAQILAIVSIPLMLILVGGITAIVGMGLELVGLFKMGEDDDNYKPAFYVAIATLVVSFLTGFAGEGILSTLLGIVSSILNLFIVYQVCTTTGNLLTGRDEALAQRGATIIKIYFVCTVVDIVCTVLSIVPLVNIIAAVAVAVSTIASLVGYIMYITFLYSGSKALA